MRFSETPEATPRDLRLDAVRTAKMCQILGKAEFYERPTDFLWSLAPARLRQDPELEAKVAAAGGELSFDDREILVRLQRTLTHPTFLQKRSVIIYGMLGSMLGINVLVCLARMLSHT